MVVVGNIILGVNETSLDLLKVVERDWYVNAIYCVSSLVHVGLVLLFAFTIECNLVMHGLLMGATALSAVSACGSCRVAQLSAECWEPATPGM